MTTSQSSKAELELIFDTLTEDGQGVLLLAARTILEDECAERRHDAGERAAAQAEQWMRIPSQ